MRETSAQTVAPTLHGRTSDRQGPQPATAVQRQQEQIAARIVAAQVSSPAANLAVNPTGILRIPAPRIAALADANQIPAHPAQQAEKDELRGRKPRTASQLRIDPLGKPGTIVHIDIAPIGRPGPLDVTITHIIHKPDTGLTHADLHVEQFILTQRQRMVAQAVVELAEFFLE